MRCVKTFSSTGEVTSRVCRRALVMEYKAASQAQATRAWRAEGA